MGRAAALPIFAGPEYVAGSGGFTNPLNSAVAGNGIAIGNVASVNATGTVLARRAVRWDALTGSVSILGVLVPQTTSTDLTRATAINSTGTSVGFAADNELAAVRWNSNTTTPTVLGSLGVDFDGKSNSAADAVNAAGVATGYARKFSPTGSFLGERPVYWAANSTTPVELAVPLNQDGLGTGRAVSININNAIVGFAGRESTSMSLGNRPMRWDAVANSATELGILGTDSSGRVAFAQASAINDAGVTIGNVTKYENGVDVGRRAVRWAKESTNAEELGILSVDANNKSLSTVSGINAHGAVVGSARRYDVPGIPQVLRGVRWEPNSSAAIELGGLPGSAGTTWGSDAFGINALGATAGYISPSGSTLASSRLATVWRPDGTAIDLNTLTTVSSKWVNLQTVNSISDTGFVSGVGSYDPDGVGVGQPAYDRLFMMLVPQVGTYGRGDANLDSKVDFSDLVTLAQNYGASNTTFGLKVADFNLDGITDFSDLVLLAQNYNFSALNATAPGSSQFHADWLLAQSLVPEPLMLPFFGVAAIIRRRRGGSACSRVPRFRTRKRARG